VPNVVISKNKERIHFPNKDDYEKVKDRYLNWHVDYYKGLGSMLKVDWKILFHNLDNFLLPVESDESLSGTLKLLFSDNADARKEWLAIEE
jgi:DNA gyrase/topoisomerase IV subunit B